MDKVSVDMVRGRGNSWPLLTLAVGVLLLGIACVASGIQAQGPEPEATPAPDDIASPLQIAAAVALWEQSGHAETFDGGMGADTTCAKCKSPFNWDPQAAAAEAALDCAACKRVPGEERPLLEGGIPVPEDEWQHIGCPVCHEPVGDSYRITASFWNQKLGEYEPVESNDELCAHCHEGDHGFRVSEEQRADQAHSGWQCLDCHDPHGGDISCEDCHDPYEGPGAVEHANHTEVTCSACHDQGGLPLWFDRDPDSNFYGEVVTIRFAHTLTSWPSHNLQTEVSCGRCHHSGTTRHPALAQEVSCSNSSCHPQGATLFWCILFEQGMR